MHIWMPSNSVTVSKSMSKTTAKQRVSGSSAKRAAKKSVKAVPTKRKLIEDTCAYLQGDECPNRTEIKDPTRVCAREVAMRERILKRAHLPLDASKDVPKEELDTRYCLYSLQKDLDIDRPDIQEKLTK